MSDLVDSIREASANHSSRCRSDSRAGSREESACAESHLSFSFRDPVTQLIHHNIIADYPTTRFNFNSRHRYG